MDGYIALEDIFVIGIRGMTGCSASALGLISTFPSQVARLEKQHVIYGGGGGGGGKLILHYAHPI
jgi:hypothetical protein